MVSTSLLIYAALWAAFGACHSGLAAPAIKARLTPMFGAGYRLAYNGFAMVTFAATYHVGRELFDPPAPFDIAPPLNAIMVAAQIVGIVVLVLALREYDLGLFAGTKQLRRARAGVAPDVLEPLATGGLHGFVRHPLYVGVLLLVWGRIATDFDLATAIFASIYLALGTWSEERKLLAAYGETYRAYRAAVPAFVPWRWGQTS